MSKLRTVSFLDFDDINTSPKTNLPLAKAGHTGPTNTSLRSQSLIFLFLFFLTSSNEFSACDDSNELSMLVLSFLGASAPSLRTLLSQLWDEARARWEFSPFFSRSILTVGSGLRCMGVSIFLAVGFFTGLFMGYQISSPNSRLKMSKQLTSHCPMAIRWLGLEPLNTLSTTRRRVRMLSVSWVFIDRLSACKLGQKAFLSHKKALTH
mmetsp:Transcript_35491/g.57266  ORF Transcript_35491/g.57266 Transcript_35491/m.57266 type:complete len:208 (+) Transcript_35491:3207-3830(+)